jgi:outer membrane lipoprotein LolB
MFIVPRIMPRLTWIWLYYFLLTGCATVPPASKPIQLSWKQRQTIANHIQDWQINGKIAVQTAQDSGSATLDWTQRNKQYTISLLAPLGAGGLKLTGQPGQVQLQAANGKHYSATSAEELLTQHWGWKLPVSSMAYWVKGLPAPDSTYQAQFDQYHRLTQLSQQGCDIRFLGYVNTSSIDLPGKIAISSPAIKAKLIIYTWNIE